MCDKYKCDSDFLLNLLKLELHLFSELCIKSAKRLVKQKNLRFIHERTRNGDALLLSAGEECDIPLFKAFKSNKLKHSAHLLVYNRLVNLLKIKTECHVVMDIQERKKCIFLENRINLPLVRWNLGNIDSVKQQFALTWLLKARYYS